MYPDVTREAQGHVRRHGEDAIVYNYEQTGTDEYGDPLFSESQSTTRMLFSGTQETDKGPEGQSEVTTPSIRIINDVAVHPPTGDKPKATTIERVRSGKQYKVQSTTDYRTGVIQVNAEEIDD